MTSFLGPVLVKNATWPDLARLAIILSAICFIHPAVKTKLQLAWHSQLTHNTQTDLGKGERKQKKKKNIGTDVVNMRPLAAPDVRQQEHPNQHCKCCGVSASVQQLDYFVLSIVVLSFLSSLFPSCLAVPSAASVCLSDRLSVSLSVCPTVRLFICAAVCISTCLCVCPPVCCVCLSVCLSFCLCLFVCPPVCWVCLLVCFSFGLSDPVYLSVCPPGCLCVQVAVYLSAQLKTRC